ncbi:MAG TPA: hypothetical protein PLE10_07310 [Brevefilum sp.]|nr:hypothetical protein [Brevefilum sp.]
MSKLPRALEVDRAVRVSNVQRQVDELRVIMFFPECSPTRC